MATNDEPDWDEVVALMQGARAKSRGYATYWEWQPDRTLEEVGVVKDLAEYLAHTKGDSWKSIRPIDDDPPDVLLLSNSGRRIGVEVTELVDERTVQRHSYRRRTGAPHAYDWAPWTKELLLDKIVEIIYRKDCKVAPKIDDYDEIILAIHTDEPNITLEIAEQAISNIVVKSSSFNRVFFLISYIPGVDTDRFPQGIPVLSVPLKMG